MIDRFGSADPCGYSAAFLPAAAGRAGAIEHASGAAVTTGRDR